jgi:hypothetical protein
MSPSGVFLPFFINLGLAITPNLIIMKKTTLLIILLFFAFFSCKDKDDNAGLLPKNRDISGLWEFTLVPHEIYLDTVIIHGQSAADFETYTSINDQVYLYQDGNGNVVGFAGTFKFTGKISGSSLELAVYANPDGLYMAERPVEEMIRMSEIGLEIDDFGLMEGMGHYLDDPYFRDLRDDRYKVFARKINNLDKSFPSMADFHSELYLKGIKDDICKVIYSITSWVIASLTDGVVRPMSQDCWLHKDGGGYYAFGHEGPGSVLPILTQAIYYPLEWSCCKVRSYGFEISIGGENISYIALKQAILSTSVQNIFNKLGFADFGELEAAMDAFYQEYGGFGISIFYDTHTNNTGLYINHEKGSGAENSDLVNAMKGAFGSNYVYAGKNIHDSWHLRRSDFLVCNTPIVICYVIGTHNVNYN